MALNVEKLEPGDVFERYRIKRFLGAGGMGHVFAAEQPNTEQEVALKIVPGARVLDPETRYVLVREAKILGRLKHPNIVRVFAAEHLEDGTFLMATELLHGKTLAQRLFAAGSLPVAEALFIASEAGRALAYGHRANVVHLDMKPENVFIVAQDDEQNPDYKVKLLDYGIAKLKVDGMKSTLRGNRMGTAAYSSPEQLEGGRVGPWSDVYSLAATAYEMIAGRHIFATGPRRQGMPQGIPLAMAQITRPPNPIEEFAPELASSPDVLELLYAGLRKSPEERPGMAEWLEMIAKARRKHIDEVTMSVVALAPTDRMPEVARPPSPRASSPDASLSADASPRPPRAAGGLGPQGTVEMQRVKAPALGPRGIGPQGTELMVKRLDARAVEQLRAASPAPPPAQQEDAKTNPLPVWMRVETPEPEPQIETPSELAQRPDVRTSFPDLVARTSESYEQAVARAEAALDHADREVRVSACAMLERLGNPDSRARLLARAQREREQVVHAAIRRSLSAIDAAVAAAEALARPAIRVAASLLSGDAELDQAARRELDTMRDLDGDAEALREHAGLRLLHVHAAVRAASAEALARVGDASSLELLDTRIAHESHADVLVRLQAAAHALRARLPAKPTRRAAPALLGRVPMRSVAIGAAIGIPVSIVLTLAFLHATAESPRPAAAASASAPGPAASVAPANDEPVRR